MKVEEVSRVDAVEAIRSTQNNQRNELVAAFRDALREGYFPEVKAKLDSGSAEMQIAFDREARSYVVKVLDRETKEVVRQIPAEDVLDRARFFVQTQVQTDRKVNR